MIWYYFDSFSLMEYSVGNFSELYVLCIWLYLDECFYCCSWVDMFDSLGVVMMEQQFKVFVFESMFDSIFFKIDSEFVEVVVVSVVFCISFLQKLLGEDINKLFWKCQMGDVSVLDIIDCFFGQKEQVVLQKLVVGGKVLVYIYCGEEMMIVFQGVFVDQKGVFNQWDFVVLNEQDEYKFVVVGCEDCIMFLVLSVLVKLMGIFI